MRGVARLALVLTLLLSGAVSVANYRIPKRTLAKAKEFAGIHLMGGMVMWGEHHALIKGIRLPTPLVRDWAEIRRHAKRERGRLLNLQLKIELLDDKSVETGTRKLVLLSELEGVERHVVAGEVVAIDDPRGEAGWLIARTLDANKGWRTVLVEMQVLKTDEGVRGKQVQAIEPYLQLVSEDELLFRD